MATFIDISLLGGFSAIFVFILVWIAVYGVLTVVKPFGDDKKGLYAFIGFTLGMLTLFSGPVIAVIAVMAPWFVAAFIFIFFLLMLMFSLGYDMDNVKSVLESEKYSDTITTFAIVIAAIILLGALGYVFFSGTGSTPTQDLQTGNDGTVNVVDTEAVGEVGSDALFGTIFHPRILGMVVVLIFGWLTILFLGRTPYVKPKK